MEKDGTFDLLPKKEVILLKKEAKSLIDLQVFYHRLYEQTAPARQIFILQTKGYESQF